MKLIITKTSRTKAITSLAYLRVGIALVGAVITFHQTEAAGSQTSAPDLPNLRGDAAVKHLQENGSYDSLEQTVAAATFVEQQKLTASDGDSYRLGTSVAISGDTAIAGFERAVYVFVRSGATWTEQQKLTEVDGSLNKFGASIAISGDTVLVGAHSTNNGQGSVHVFVRSGTTWTEQQKLVASDAAGTAFFGSAVAVEGDTAIVGARVAKIGSNTSQGAAYIFVRNGTTWTEQRKLIASDGAAQDQFGYSVAISGDTVLVGAWSDAIGANDSQGSAYVFFRNGTAWAEQQKLTASDGAAHDDFGISVALSGETAIVGAQAADVSVSDQGSAYVFVRNGTTWSEQQKLTMSNAVPARFGFSVAITGDTAIIGALSDLVGGNHAQGSAYIFARSGTTWAQQQRLTASDGAAADKFGTSVAVSGNTIVIGASEAKIGDKFRQGAAYIFTSGTTATASLLNIATRMHVGMDPNQLIGGFIIDGSEPKKVIILATGPSLAQFGIPGVLANPILQLFRGNTLVASNDNWKVPAQAEIQATGLQPKHDLESALVRTLAPGNYTAIVRGTNGGTGVGTVQVYDLAQNAKSKLANISSRGLVQPGDDKAMIAGFIIGGSGTGNPRVVVRALGPSLSAFGIANSLPDPTLELKNANGTTLLANDEWQQSQQKAEITNRGLAPSNVHESALAISLPKGGYTAIVRGKGSANGVAVVEVYNVQ